MDEQSTCGPAELRNAQTQSDAQQPSLCASCVRYNIVPITPGTGSAAILALLHCFISESQNSKDPDSKSKSATEPFLSPLLVVLMAGMGSMVRAGYPEYTVVPGRTIVSSL